MDKEDVVCVYIYKMEYSAIKKNEIMSSVATWMDLEIVILSEVSQTEKDKYYMDQLLSTILSYPVVVLLKVKSFNVSIHFPNFYQM